MRNASGKGLATATKKPGRKAGLLFFTIDMSAAASEWGNGGEWRRRFSREIDPMGSAFEDSFEAKLVAGDGTIARDGTRSCRFR